MKKLLLLSFLSAFLSISCKTIKYPEASAFTPTKYNYAAFSANMQAAKINELQKRVFISAANKVINTEEKLILSLGTTTLRRGYFKVNDTLNLEYFTFEPKVVKKTGIYFQGNRTTILSFADKLFELSELTSSKLYVLNYRGYGNSDGVPSFDSQFSDNIAFINHIQQADKKNLDFAIGYSLGSVFATYSAVEHQFNSLYLLAPLSNARQLFKHVKKLNTPEKNTFSRSFITVTADKHLRSISNTEKIKQFSGRLAIFHGTVDKELPFSMGESLYKSYPSASKEFITLQGGHEAPFEQEGWKALVERIK